MIFKRPNLKKSLHTALAIALLALPFVGDALKSSTYAAPNITPYQVTVDGWFNGISTSSNGDVVALSTFSAKRFGRDGVLKNTYTIPYESPDPVNPSAVGLLEDADGNVWTTTFESRAGCSTGGITKLTKFSPNGTIVQYTILDESEGCGYMQVTNLTIDPAGNFWVGTRGLDENKFFVMSPSGQLLHTYPVGQQPQFGYDSVLGPDGNIWFGCFTEDAGQAGICKVNMQGGISIYPQDPGTWVLSVTSGPSEELWFSGVEGGGFNPHLDMTNGIVGTVGTDGVLTKYILPGKPFTMTIKGNGEYLWAAALDFSEGSLTEENIDIVGRPILFAFNAPGGGVNPNPENPTPEPPRTGVVAIATVLTIASFTLIVLLAKAYEHKYHRTHLDK